VHCWIAGHRAGWHTVVFVLCDVVSPMPKLRIWLIFRGSLFLFLSYFPRLPDLPNNSAKNQYTWQTAVGVAAICLLHGVATVVISVAFIYARPDLLGGWANTLGVGATILAAIQYFPQIWMTYTLAHVGSLSIPMMLIQTPGSFVWAGSLAARLGVEGWSTWGIFLVTGCLQGCLLVMAIYFELKARKESQGTGDAVSTTLSFAQNRLTRCSRTPLALLGTSVARELMQRQTMREVQLWRMFRLLEHRCSKAQHDALLDEGMVHLNKQITVQIPCFECTICMLLPVPSDLVEI
jgi:hypothetical protein